MVYINSYLGFFTQCQVTTQSLGGLRITHLAQGYYTLNSNVSCALQKLP